MRSYLANRLQIVELEGVKSSITKLKHGVPQGFILELLLFLIYINDLPNALQNSHILFADYTCLLISDNNTEILETKCNDDLANVSEWMLANRLTLNLHKTQILLLPFKMKYPVSLDFKLMLDNSNINMLHLVKYLGISLESSLNFSPHIQVIEKLVSSGIGVLFKLKPCAPTQVLLSVYHALIHPHLVYGILVWANTNTSRNYLHKLQVLQNKCLRILDEWKVKQKLALLFLKYNIISINQLIKFEIAKLIFSYRNSNLPQTFDLYFKYINEISPYSTRKLEKKFYLPIYKTTQAQKSIKFIGVKIWNEIPNQTRALTFKKFNVEYKMYLMLNNPIV